MVVPKPGTTLDVNELLEYAGSVLADFKVPQFVVVRQEPLPRNPGGKVIKKLLRETVNWGKQIKRTKGE